MARRRTSLGMIGDRRRRNACFLKRVSGIKKKAMELSTLCDIPVLLVCYGPDGQAASWPEDPADLDRVLHLYRGLAEPGRSRNSHDLASFLKDQFKKELCKAKGGGGGDRIEDMTTPDGLVRVGEILDSRLEAVRERIRALQEGKERKDLEGVDHDDQLVSWQEQEYWTELQLLLEGSQDSVDLDTILQDTYSSTTTSADEDRPPPPPPPPTSDLLSNWQQLPPPIFDPLLATLPEPSPLQTNYQNDLPLRALPPLPPAPMQERHGMTWSYEYSQNGFADDGAIASSSAYTVMPNYWLDHGINISTGSSHGQGDYVSSIGGGYNGKLDVLFFDSWGSTSGAYNIPTGFGPDPNVLAATPSLTLLPRRLGVNTSPWIN